MSICFLRVQDSSSGGGTVSVSCCCITTILPTPRMVANNKHVLLLLSLLVNCPAFWSWQGLLMPTKCHQLCDHAWPHLCVWGPLAVDSLGWPELDNWALLIVSYPPAGYLWLTLMTATEFQQGKQKQSRSPEDKVKTGTPTSTRSYWGKQAARPTQILGLKK